MASLADLFSPTFLMFLGILVFIVALMVVYFESKMRDQNHKIASMLSLVSTLAEDMNGVKMSFNQLGVTRMSGSGAENFQQSLENSRNVFSSNNAENKLIEVSDNDYDVEEEEDVYEDDDDDSIDDDDIDDDSFDDDDNDDLNNDDIKILKIDINPQNHSSGDNDVELDDMDELYLDEELSETESLKDESKQALSSEEIPSEEIPSEEKSSEHLKTIAINLDDESHDFSEYKKLPLPKLRVVVSEKGLATDTSKLKKNELLKLLGVE